MESICPICDGTFTLSQKIKDQIHKDLNVDDVVSKAINQLYDDRVIDDPTKKALFLTHNAPLQKAVEEGYGNTLAKIEYGTPNYEFLKQLQTNTAVFAIFKSHASMKEMAGLLKDNEGNLRTKDDFKREALKIDSNYRTTKLDAEYDTAVRSARMASQWSKYQANKHLYPNLRYLLTKAAKPDEKHLAYVGIVRPVDDIFWNAHYPPNRWRCQCGVESTDSEAEDIPDNLPPVPAEFAFNSGKTGQVFDLKHSEYIKSVPGKEQPALIKQAESVINTEAAKSVAYQPVHKTKDSATVSAHPIAFNNQDFKEVVAEGRVLAKTGTDVKVLPEIKDAKLREQLTPKGAKDQKNPDYLLDNKIVADLKTLTEPTKKAVSGAFTRCFEQCENIVLKVPEDLSITSEELRRYIKGKLSHAAYTTFDNVWIDFKGKIYKTNRMKIVQLDEWPIKAK